MDASRIILDCRQFSNIVVYYMLEHACGMLEGDDTLSHQPSIRDIARVAGVSVATVSRVLAKRGNTSPQMQKKVMDAIEELHYQPNYAARMLRTGRTPYIGIVISDITSEHFSRLVFRLQTRLFEQGYLSFICSASDSDSMLEKYIQMFSAQNYCGLIYVATILDERDNLPADIPSVFIECSPPKRFDAPYVIVKADHMQAGIDGTNLLIERGCRSILLLRHAKNISHVSSKELGYLHALWQHHITFQKNWIIPIDRSPVNSARNAILELLQRGIPFDGVYCNSDIAVTGILSVLNEKGISVPGEVKVLGYGDTELAACYAPPISSVSIDTDGIVDIALCSMLLLLAQETPEKTEYVLPIQIVERQTT